MAFKILKKTDDLDYKQALLGNSGVYSIGDVIMPGTTTHAGAIVGALNSTSQYTGIVTGVLTGIYQNGKPLEISTAYTASATNETTGANVYGEFVPAYIDLEYIVDMSQGLTTTTSSNLAGMFYLGYGTYGTTSTHYNAGASNILTQNSQLDETSYAAFTTQLQFFSYGAYTIGAINSSNLYTQVTGKFCPTKVV